MVFHLYIKVACDYTVHTYISLLKFKKVYCPSFFPEVVTEGALTPLMALCMAEDSTITILSLATLGVVLENQVNVSSFIEVSRKLPMKLFN